MITKHLKTLFAPWHRFVSKDIFKAQNFGDKLGNWVFDIFTRFLAAGIRLSVISAGVLMQIIVVVFFSALFVVWIFWPIIVLGLLAEGTRLIVT